MIAFFAVIYIIVCYLLGAYYFLWKISDYAPGYYMRAWGRFYFVFSPLSVPIVLFIFATND